MALFTFAFPMNVDSGGRIATDLTPDSQVRCLAHTEIGQRIDDPAYGFPPFAFEQEALGDEIRRPITLVLTQRAIVEYIPDLRLIAVDVLRDRENRRLGIGVQYQNNQRLALDEESLFGLGLDDA